MAAHAPPLDALLAAPVLGAFDTRWMIGCPSQASCSALSARRRSRGAGVSA